jgi:hypothetical protein
MRKPTREEVISYKQVILSLSVKTHPKTELGMLRVIAKYFHCSTKEIKAIMAE